MKLKEYARQQGISYKTAWRWYHAGKLPGHQMDTGTILLDQERPAASQATKATRVAIYARVSSAENTPDLDRQAERLTAYCAAKGYAVSRIVKEIGSGTSDARPKFLALLEDPSIGLMVVEHQDRATRCGFRYLETLLRGQGRRIEVVNLAENGEEDVLADLRALLYAFTARLYGQRRAKRKTDTLLQALEAGESEGEGEPATSSGSRSEAGQP